MAATTGRERFEALFDAQFDRCTHLARRIVHDDQVAEEVAAEAFARLWARWARLQDESPAGWLVRVTVNLAVDVARRRTASVEPVAEMRSEDEQTAVRLDLVGALRQLPRRQREVVSLRYLAGLSEAQVVEVLGISAGSVKTHLHRGLARLRGGLGPRLETEVVADGS